MESKNNEENIPEKVMYGFRLAHKRLLDKARQDDKTLVIERDGKIIYIKARDL